MNSFHFVTIDAVGNLLNLTCYGFFLQHNKKLNKKRNNVSEDVLFQDPNENLNSRKPFK